MSTGSKIAPASQNTRFNFKSLGKTFNRTKARVYFFIKLESIVKCKHEKILLISLYISKNIYGLILI